MWARKGYSLEPEGQRGNCFVNFVVRGPCVGRATAAAQVGKLASLGGASLASSRAAAAAAQRRHRHARTHGMGRPHTRGQSRTQTQPRTAIGTVSPSRERRWRGGEGGSVEEGSSLQSTAGGAARYKSNSVRHNAALARGRASWECLSIHHGAHEETRVHPRRP